MEVCLSAYGGNHTEAIVCVTALTTCQRAGGTAGPTPAAFPLWISSGGSPARTCSVKEFHADSVTHTHRQTLTPCQHGPVYLVEGGQVVSGLDEEGLVDSGMVHVVGRCRHQTQKHVQWTQLLRQLERTSGRQMIIFSFSSSVCVYIFS